MFSFFCHARQNQTSCDGRIENDKLDSRIWLLVEQERRAEPQCDGLGPIRLWKGVTRDSRGASFERHGRNGC